MLGNVELFDQLSKTVDNFAKEHPQFIGLETGKKTYIWLNNF